MSLPLSGVVLAALATAPEPIRHYELDNGLDVVLIEDHRRPTVALRLRFEVGSVDDPPGRGGLAHVVEHLSYEGSRHISQEAADQHYGLRGVMSNASTDYTHTEYYAQGPSKALEAMLWVESDRMGFVRGVHGSQTLHVVKTIVASERRQRFESRPTAELIFRAQSELYPADHACAGGVIGDQATIAAVSMANVDAFLEARYRPDIATLVLVGALPDNAEALVERYFGTLPSASGPPPKPAPVAEPGVIGERRVIAEKGLRGAPSLAIAWPSPRLYEDGDAALDVLAQALVLGAARRLTAGDPGGGFARFVAVQSSSSACSHFVLTAIGRPGASAEQLLGAVDRVLDRVAEGELRDAEIAGASARQIADSRDARGPLLSRAAAAASNTVNLGTPERRSADERRWSEIDGRAIQAVARAVLRDDRRIVVLAESRSKPRSQPKSTPKSKPKAKPGEVK